MDLVLLSLSFMCFSIFFCTYKVTSFRTHKKNLVYDNELYESSAYVNEIAL